MMKDVIDGVWRNPGIARIDFVAGRRLCKILTPQDKCADRH